MTFYFVPENDGMTTVGGYYFRTLKEAKAKAKEIAIYSDATVQRYEVPTATKGDILNILNHDSFATEMIDVYTAKAPKQVRGEDV